MKAKSLRVIARAWTRTHVHRTWSQDSLIFLWLYASCRLMRWLNSQMTRPSSQSSWVAEQGLEPKGDNCRAHTLNPCPALPGRALVWGFPFLWPTWVPGPLVVSHASSRKSQCPLSRGLSKRSTRQPALLYSVLACVVVCPHKGGH